MKRNLLSIGKMAEMNQTTVPTLRLYDQLGLLKPRHVDGETGYRYYDINQNARLDMIAYMKELGMSLKEIQGVLEAEDIALIEQILARKNEQIHQQIRDLRLRHNAVERAIASIERYRKSPATGTIALEYIDRRYIWGISCPENFYEKDISSYEQALTDLRKALLEKNCPQIHSYNTGHLYHAGKLCPRAFRGGPRVHLHRPAGPGLRPERLGGGQRHVCLHLSGSLRQRNRLRQQTIGILQE